MVSSTGQLSHEIVSRIHATWKCYSGTGILCDRCINERLKSKIFRIVVCSVNLYGSRRFIVLVGYQTQWMPSHGNEGDDLCYYHVRSEGLRIPFGVGTYRGKIFGRNSFDGMVMQVPMARIHCTAINIQVDEKRQRGWPNQSWRDMLDGDLRALRLHSNKCRTERSGKFDLDARPH